MGLCFPKQPEHLIPKAPGLLVGVYIQLASSLTHLSTETPISFAPVCIFFPAALFPSGQQSKDEKRLITGASISVTLFIPPEATAPLTL